MTTVSQPRPQSATSAANLGKTVRQVLEFVFPFIVVGVLWELLARSGLIRAEVLPPPSVLMLKFWDLLWIKGTLLHHLSRSMYRLLIGYSLAVGLGVVTGTLLAVNRTVRDMFSPVLSLLISVPTIAWVPILLVVMGLGNKTVITAIFLGGFFAITFNTIRGIQMVDKDQINAARLMGGGRSLKLFASVLLPGAMVAIITGMRLGIGYAWRALVGGEMLSASIEWGIGKMIYQARFWNDVAVMFVGLMVIGVSGFLLDRIFLKWLERVTVEKWGMLAKR